MIRFDLGSVSTVVALGAHPDDIEIGCAGTLLHLAGDFPHLRYLFLIVASDSVREAEAMASAEGLLGDRVTVRTGGFRDGHLPYRKASEAKDWLREALSSSRPGLALAPSVEDMHQDHRLVGTFAWELLRRVPILEYEIPKWETEGLKPNLFVPLEELEVKTKLKHLDTYFPSQGDKQACRAQLLESVMRTRGAQAGSYPYSEAFIARKMTLSPVAPAPDDAPVTAATADTGM